MIVCPVCEHAQTAAAECEACGSRLDDRAAAARPAPAPLEGLEPTAHEPIRVRAERLPDLEPTAHAPAGDVPADPLDLDPARAAPVDVDAPGLEDLERTEAGIPGDGPTPLPVFPVCRYCRTPALPGERICARCGMRLPVVQDAEAPARVARRCGCGALVAGSACPACGARSPG